MQNSNSISLQKGIEELKQMFPNFDEDIIVCVLIENDKQFEKAVDALLMMNGTANKVDREEPEISIFRNKSSMASYESNSNKKDLEVDKRESLNRNKIQIEKKENINYNIDENVNKPAMKTLDNSVEIKKKNSFGQKFKSWMNNIFTNKKNKGDKEQIKGYQSLGQNEN